MMARISLLALASWAGAVCAADITVVQSSEAGDAWAPVAGLSWTTDFPSLVDVTVDRSRRRQEVLGFGEPVILCSTCWEGAKYRKQSWLTRTLLVASFRRHGDDGHDRVQCDGVDE